MPERPPRLVALVILDGWGCAPPGPGERRRARRDAGLRPALGRVPAHDAEASGEAVGLPAGQMGNSEVGHLTIGSGRILDQDLQRVNRAIADGSFFENPALRRRSSAGGNVHLLGLVSHGGVHSHIDHLQALLRFAPERTWIHAFTDGRDVSPHAAVHDLAELPAERIATVCGRYYAMDRDQRWERTRPRLRGDRRGRGRARGRSGRGGARAATSAVSPTSSSSRSCSTAGRGSSRDDAAIFFNFRPDRARQLTQRAARGRLRRDDDDALPRRARLPGRLRASSRCDETLAEVLAEHGLRQLHVAETEKYAHVTYFFNGGREEEWPGETRLLVPSARATSATYDQKPEMSADGGRRRVLRRSSARRLQLRGRQLREPGHGRPHRRDPGGRQGGRDRGRAASAASSRPSSARAAWPDHRRPRQRGDRCSRRTARARTPRTPRIPSRWSSPTRTRASATAASSAISPRPFSLARASETFTDVGQKSLQLAHFGWLDTPHFPSILRTPCHWPSPISASCGKRNAATSERSRSSSAPTRRPSSTTCSGSWAATGRSPRI